MEFLVEFILDICFDFGTWAGKNKKIPRPVRVLCLLLVTLVSLGIIFGTVYLGVLLTKENIAVGIMVIAVGIFILFAGVYKSVKTYKKMKEESQNEK